MDLQEFLNRTKILRSIDRDELVKAGVDMNDDRRWVEFMEQPIPFLIRTDDDVAAKIWAIVEKRAGEPKAPIDIWRRTLQRIAKWHGEFPPSGSTHPDGSPMSYEFAYGSSGERDFMRGLAQLALLTEIPTLDKAALRESLGQVREFVESEVDNRGAAGGEMSDYTDEARDALDRVDSAMELLK